MTVLQRDLYQGQRGQADNDRFEQLAHSNVVNGKLVREIELNLKKCLGFYGYDSVLLIHLSLVRTSSALEAPALMYVWFQGTHSCLGREMRTYTVYYEGFCGLIHSIRIRP